MCAQRSASRGGLFGSSRPGAVALVEAPVSQAYMRKARITFWVVAIATLLVTGVALRHARPAVTVGISFLSALVAGVLAMVGVTVWPVARVLWHWAAEITTGLVLLIVWTLLADATSGLWALLVLAALAGGVFGWSPARRRVAAFVWCAVTRHRLRMCFAQFVRATTTRTHHVGLPLVLLACPTPAGVRVWVWLRPGLDLADLDGKADKLAVACWAGLVRVARVSERHAALVRIDVTRRDPLSCLVSSALADGVPIPVSPGLPPLGFAPLGLDLDEVPEPPPTPAGGSGRR